MVTTSTEREHVERVMADLSFIADRMVANPTARDRIMANVDALAKLLSGALFAGGRAAPKRGKMPSSQRVDE